MCFFADNVFSLYLRSSLNAIMLLDLAQKLLMPSHVGVWKAWIWIDESLDLNCEWNVEITDNTLRYGRDVAFAGNVLGGLCGINRFSVLLCWFLIAEFYTRFVIWTSILVSSSLNPKSKKHPIVLYRFLLDTDEGSDI